MSFKIGDKVACTCGCGVKGEITAPDQYVAGFWLVALTEDAGMLAKGESFPIESKTLRLISTHTWRVGDRFKVKSANGSDWYGTIASLPPAYHLMDEDGKSWEWGTWEEFEKRAVHVPAAQRTPTAPLVCRRCHEHNNYAEPNLADGGYACYSCRKYHSYGCK